MIAGTGIDIVELERIQQLLLKRKGSFLKRILTESEKDQLPEEPRRQTEFVAGRFSAKEAMAKAIGTGIGKSLSWQDIAILKNEEGKPYVVLSDNVYDLIPSGSRVHVSISHSRDYCVSHIIIEL